MNFLCTFVIPSIGKIPFRLTSCSIRRLVEQCLVILYFLGLETVLYSLSCLYGVGERRACVANKSIIVCQGQHAHEDGRIFFFNQSWLD